jgi:hypothetical protein
LELHGHAQFHVSSREHLACRSKQERRAALLPRAQDPGIRIAND